MLKEIFWAIVIVLIDKIPGSPIDLFPASEVVTSPLLRFFVIYIWQQGQRYGNAYSAFPVSGVSPRHQQQCLATYHAFTFSASRNYGWLMGLSKQTFASEIYNYVGTTPSGGRSAGNLGIDNRSASTISGRACHGQATPNWLLIWNALSYRPFAFHPAATVVRSMLTCRYIASHVYKSGPACLNLFISVTWCCTY